jgi:uncharacterized glyoxalase superfamily protein PhnB/DNA-binding XRE family transcriptional regulator
MRPTRKKPRMETNPTGQKIRALREKKAWTQEHLAGAAAISPRTVQRAEEGVMSAETKTAIAGALGVPVETLGADLRPTVQPVLIYEDSRAAVDWLVKAFGFTVRERVADENGQVIHSELVLGAGVVMVTLAGQRSRFASPKMLSGRATGFTYVFVDDVEQHCARAKKAGAKMVAELEVSWGQRRYRCLDLEGHEWCFSQGVES